MHDQKPNRLDGATLSGWHRHLQRFALVPALLISSFCMALISQPAGAESAALLGKKTINLVTADGARQAVAEIEFTANGSASSYQINWNDAPFTDHFLSMRPFKCLEGETKHWCRVPYPYDNRHTVSPDDLADLEYDLLFLWKGATEYGINMWNGVYYKLAIEGDKLVGRIFEMDMNTLAAPPEGDKKYRPLGPHDIEEGDIDSHWLPLVVIE